MSHWAAEAAKEKVQAQSDKLAKDADETVKQTAEKLHGQAKQKLDELVKQSTVDETFISTLSQGRARMVEKLVKEMESAAEQLSQIRRMAESSDSQIQSAARSAQMEIEAVKREIRNLETSKRDLLAQIEETRKTLAHLREQLADAAVLETEAKGVTLDNVRSILRLLKEEKYAETIGGRIDKIDSQLKSGVFNKITADSIQLVNTKGKTVITPGVVEITCVTEGKWPLVQRIGYIRYNDKGALSVGVDLRDGRDGVVYLGLGVDGKFEQINVK